MDRSAALAALTAPGEPYELEDVELYGRTCRAFRHAPPTLRDLFDESRSDLPFLVYDDERLSFEKAWGEACRLGALLVEQYGVRHGDRVAISMRNYPEWIIAFMAVTSVGGVAVAMNSLWQPNELAYGLENSGSKVLLADEERLERLSRCETVFPELVALGVRTAETYGLKNTRPLAEALAGLDVSEMPAADTHPNDDATILYTSGSTGHPKGVVSCHRNIITALLSWELDAHAAAKMRGRELPVPLEQPATLLGVPLFHATGSHAVYLSSYRAQRRIVSMYKWDVERAAELIERERISSVIAPPAMTGDLVAVAKRTKRDLSSLLTVGGGGAARAPSQVRNIERAFSNALPNTGWVRGTSVVRGYWNRPDADAETFVEGWLRTGDVAYLDAEGFLYIVDRIKDLVIRGGENIGCGAVEAALLEHPDVMEASVYGVPDERLGEEVGATLYSAASLDADDVRAFLEPRLARFEIPRHFCFSKAPLPRTASGKILKRQLREAALRELGLA